jgi:Holliday junction resolvasome RuvABC endonuclease subunit
MKILVNDPSITAWGWAVVTLDGRVARINETGCIKTEPDYKKKKIRKGDDTVRRLSVISDVLTEQHEKHNLDWVLSELPHGSQSASAAVMIGAVAGIISSYSSCFNLPVEWYTEGDSKKNLLGRRSASKQATVDAIVEIYGDEWVRDIKYKDQAVADALAVFHVGRSSSQALIYASNEK